MRAYTVASLALRQCVRAREPKTDAKSNAAGTLAAALARVAPGVLSRAVGGAGKRILARRSRA